MLTQEELTTKYWILRKIRNIQNYFEVHNKTHFDGTIEDFMFSGLADQKEISFTFHLIPSDTPNIHYILTEANIHLTADEITNIYALAQNGNPKISVTLEKEKLPVVLPVETRFSKIRKSTMMITIF